MATKTEQIREYITNYDLRGGWTKQEYKDSIRRQINSKIANLLSEQRDTPMGVSEWMKIGKANGYHDYWKDMTRIALNKEILACFKEWKKQGRTDEQIYGVENFLSGKIQIK